MKRTLMSLVLALAMVVSLFVPAMAAQENDIAPQIESELKGAIIILHTNDVHGAIDGYAKVAAMKAAYEAEGAYVLLVDAGDFIQGDSTVNTTQGATAIELMNMAGYDLVTLGNHEFDFGYANLVELAKTADFPIVAANVLFEGKAAFDGTKTFTAPDGTKIGFFGLSTPETATKAHPAKIEGVTFLAGEELYKCAQAQADALKADGCDVIVALGHLGIDVESTGNRSIDVLEKVTGVDLFIDGHSHSDLDAISAVTDGTGKVGETILTSTGTKLGNVGAAVISDGILEAITIDSAEVTLSDEAIATRAAAIKAEIDAEYGAVFAQTEVKLNGDKAPGNRNMETNLGNLITDALLWKAEAQGEKVDAAITNGGGIRATIEAGAMTKKDINTVLPFGNTLNIVKVTGSELLEVLEASTYCTPDAVGGFPQVAGITFSIDTAAPFDAGDLYPGSTYSKPSSINRITIDTVGGKAFNKADTYTVATNDFMAAGGDTYYAFTKATANYDLGLPLDEVVMEYIKSELDGVVTAKKYGAGEGRITVKYNGIEPAKWYTAAAKYVVDEGIMTGVNKYGEFNPTGTVTRGTVMKMLYNLAGAPAFDGGEPTFTDIKAQWYAEATHWGQVNGIVSGKADGTFGGDDVITREETAQMIANYAKLEGIGVDQSGMAMKEAPDYADITPEYLGGMTFCYFGGLIQGDKAGNLLPQGTMTRNQLAQLMFNFSKLTPDYTEEIVKIEVAAIKGIPAHTVVGTLTIPTKATKSAKAPAVVMLHGTGSNRDEAGMGYAMAAPAMAREGVATLRIDFMGTAPDMAEDYQHYSYTSANIDAKAAADYLATLENIDSKNLGILGWSQGGTNALLAAAQYPETFKAVVTWAGALDLTMLFGETSFEDAYAVAKEEGTFTMKLDWRTPSDLPVGLKWFEDVKNTDLLNEIDKMKAPVLAIQGAADDVVDPESAAKIVTASNHADSDSHLIENCDHTFNVFSGDYTALNDAISAGTAFFMDVFGMATEEAAA